MSLAERLANRKKLRKVPASQKPKEKELMILPDTPFVWDYGHIEFSNFFSPHSKLCPKCSSNVPERVFCLSCGERISKKASSSSKKEEEEESTTTTKVRIGMLDAPGINKSSFDGLKDIISEFPSKYSIQILSPSDIGGEKEELDKIDVLVMAGGAHHPALAKVGDSGRRNLLHFLENGGGFVGVCGGAYFAWHLGVAAIHCQGTHFENEKFSGLQGNARLETLPSYNQLFGLRKGDASGKSEDDDLQSKDFSPSSSPPSSPPSSPSPPSPFEQGETELVYINGPLMLPPLFKRGLPEVVPLARFKDDLCAEYDKKVKSMLTGEATSGIWSCFACTFDNQDSDLHCVMCETPRPSPGSSSSSSSSPGQESEREKALKDRPPVGVMVGSSAIVGTCFGKGRLVLFSPHPEFAKETRGLVVKAIDMVTPLPQ